MFNRARHIIKHHEIADFERLIKTYRQRGEHVAQDGLHGQGDGDTAHTQTGDQRGNIDAGVRQNRQQHHRPDQYSQDHAEDHQRHRVTVRVRRPHQIAHPGLHTLIEPDSHLQSDN